jgi:hypothetical protein
MSRWSSALGPSKGSSNYLRQTQELWRHRGVVASLETKLTMGDIARRIALYNRTYVLAWQGLPERTKALVPNISRQIDEVIWAQIRGGKTEITMIAATAVKTVFGPVAYTIYAPPVGRPRHSQSPHMFRRAS